MRLITMLNGSELGVPAGRLHQALRAGDASDEARHKMLDRDIRHLNELGYDIRNTAPTGAEGVYRMFAHDNRLRVLLTPAQRGELLRAALATGRDDLAAHLEPAGQPSRAAARDSAPATQLDRVLRAASRRCLLGFDYKGRARTVHPHGVHSGPSGWYLTGREEGQQVVKEFVVSRMDDVVLAEPGSSELVERATRPSLDPLSWTQDPATDVVLELDREHLPLMTTVLGEPARVVEHGGRLAATYPVTNRAFFRWRVYELGTRVRVVAPADVVAEIRRELASIVAGAS